MTEQATEDQPTVVERLAELARLYQYAIAAGRSKTAERYLARYERLVTECNGGVDPLL